MSLSTLRIVACHRHTRTGACSLHGVLLACRGSTTSNSDACAHDSSEGRILHQSARLMFFSRFSLSDRGALNPCGACKTQSPLPPGSRLSRSVQALRSTTEIVRGWEVAALQKTRSVWCDLCWLTRNLRGLCIPSRNSLRSCRHLVFCLLVT